MPTYLVSFTIPSGQRGSRPGSYIMQLPEVPASMDAVESITGDLARTYGTERVVLLDCSLLPDHETHPAGQSPYGYFLTCQAVDADGRHRLMSMEFAMGNPIRTLGELRYAEEWLRRTNGAERLHLLSCIPLQSTRIQL